MRRIPIVAAVLLAFLSGCSGGDVKKDSHGVTVKTAQGEKVRLQVLGDKIIRVTAIPKGDMPTRASLCVVPQEGKPAFQVDKGEDVVTVSTPAIKAEVALDGGSVTFKDASGKTLLSEERGGRKFTPITVEGKSEYTVSQVFSSPDDEAFYGLGQHQGMDYNRKGTNEELFQYNTKVSVPFVMSTRGYGILWDSYSLSRFGNPAPYAQLGKVFTLYDKDGKEGHLTGEYTPAEGESLIRDEDSLYYENEWAIKNLPKMKLKGAKVVYEGFISAPEDADYFFTLYYAGSQKVSIGGKEVVSERWRPAWNPNSYKFKVALKKGEKTPIRLEWLPDGDVSYMGLRVAQPRSVAEQSKLSFWSEMNPSVDYYFVAGENMDEIIHGYRTLTGKAQVMPRWVMGFWQSRERYSTQEQLVSTFAELRHRGIPVDNIVQDWQYWADDQWGSHVFESSRYPDPEKMLDDIHAMHGRFMISVWPKFYTNTDNYQALKAKGYVYPQAEKDGLTDWLGHPESFYDAYSEGGRKMFWQQMDDNLYSKYGKKIDAWWMDASEPNLRDCLPMEYQKALTTPTALGPSTEYLNAYALENADAIYNGQRSVDPDKRVFLLTRSGFAGLQRFSTATWSGDIGTSWTDMHAQMAAGLGYSMSGIPFWGMDIGGFSVMDRFTAAQGQFNSTGTVNEDLREWRELQTRWHQFGAFVPLFRAHGQWPERELWNISPEGTPTYESILWYMKLRYNLMPYLYSMAGAVWMKDYTMMRGLVMDFPSDMKVRDISDQWMFGPAFMPCPVYEYGARTRMVYLPEGAGWYDFYSGKYLKGGQSFSAEAPYERMPLYVKAGSIVPFGPDIQYSDEKPADVIRLYVYEGADASFTIYEDENVNYNYEKGAYATIPIMWDEASRTLTIGDRKGSFPGMLESREFVIVPVSKDAAHPYDPAADGQKIQYSGASVSVKL